jgi:membrane fusion protein (multidrug efflux system)
MKKRIILTILGLLVLIALLAAVKIGQFGAMISQAKNYVPPPETVTTAVARVETWENTLTAVGTLKAVQGVTVSAELPGKVVKISFDSGTAVKKGDLLVSQDTSSEEAQLPGAIAQATFALTDLDRASGMVKDNIISRADYDRAVATREQELSQANDIRATISKKKIRAPFSGRLGIRQVNLGQMLGAGDPIVTLQSLDPIYVEFSLPQQQLSRLRTGLPVRVTCDALPGETVEGRITAINSLVEDETRNIRLQATVANRDGKLRPGMFVNTEVGLPARMEVLVIPSTSVLYAPYGDSVFVVVDDKKKKGGKTLKQQFVRLGEKRGDFVAVASGLKKGETVVSTGVFKLRNGQTLVVDNKLAPQFRQAPRPENN